MTELPIPPQATIDPGASELARVWRTGAAQHLTLDIGTTPDPAYWGLLLVDLARHLSVAYGERGLERQHVLDRIRAAFDAEWEYPTDLPTSAD